MTLEKEQLDRLSKELTDAERAHTPIEPLTDRFLEITMPEAYAIQLRTIQSKVDAGEAVVGKKVGLCIRAAQE